MQRLVSDLNQAYRGNRALHARDTEAAGFSWIEADSAEESILIFARHGMGADPPIVVVVNFTPVPRASRRIGLPAAGFWKEIINTDGADYGGSNLGNMGGVVAEPLPHRGQPWSALMTVPPLTTMILGPAGSRQS